MKVPSLLFAGFIFAGLLGPATAQTKNPNPSLRTHLTPVTTGPTKYVPPKQSPTKGPSTSLSHGPVQNSNAHLVNLQMRQKKSQIKKDLKDGKITKDQAKAAWKQLKAGRQKELEYFHQNGKKVITDKQKQQLDQMSVGTPSPR